MRGGTSPLSGSDVDVERKVVLARNSWGEAFGAKGNFYFSFDDFGRLLSEQGDVTVFVPLSTPVAPPTPTPSTADQVLVAAFDAWRKARGV